MSDLIEARYCKARDVARRLSISTTQLYRLLQRGEFVKPLKIGHATRFDVHAVDEWVKAQAVDN